ncbi:hypothetical protein HPB52_008619 [Rhipicephalus sanguineus]|uniref:RING-type domain-containing protein n=1 Tax=Rhipicephalus sanguineus TaxID=34632 RepID=A0A9D4T7A6_RHISA|nr:hypothetical protein HPB52_008619 [Rhipicephalus sanguineus]
MAFWEYTLTGFGEFFEQRRVTFAEPMPADRVCSICGRIPSNAAVLPCAHVSCLECRVEVCDAKRCPLDETAVTEEELVPSRTDSCYLEKRRIVCVVGGRKCPSNFSGKLSELIAHLPICRGGDVHCTKCYRPVAREVIVEHYRQCCDSNSTGHSGTAARVREAVEGYRGIKEDVENLRQRALDVRHSEVDLVNAANGLVERLASLDHSLSAPQEMASGVDREGVSSQSPKPPAASGPLRSASKPGACIAACVFTQAYCAHTSVTRSKEELRIGSGRHSLSGYTFYLRSIYSWGCEGRDGVSVGFSMYLGAGEWDDYVEWPFSKKVTVIIAHPRDATKDLRLPLFVEGLKVVKKPAPEKTNGECETEKTSWDDIERGGYITKNNLYVHVEFE